MQTTIQTSGETESRQQQLCPTDRDEIQGNLL